MSIIIGLQYTFVTYCVSTCRSVRSLIVTIDGRPVVIHSTLWLNVARGSQLKLFNGFLWLVDKMVNTHSHTMSPTRATSEIRLVFASLVLKIEVNLNRPLKAELKIVW